MATVAGAVKDILKKQPFIQEALAKGIINFAAYAEVIQPDVEAIVDQKVKHAAVMMALRRYADKAEESVRQTLRFDARSHIIARDGLVELTVTRTADTMEKIQMLSATLSPEDGTFLTITCGIYEITILATKALLPQLKKLFTTSERRELVENLSGVTITIPSTFSDTPGFFFVTTRAFAWNNINIREIVSTYQELTLIVKTKDVAQSFATLAQLLEEHS